MGEHGGAPGIGQGDGGTAELPAEALQRSLGDGRGVVSAFAQRGDAHGEGVETVEQVAAEAAFGDALGEVLVRCGDDPCAYSAFLGAAHAPEPPVLDHQEQFGLQFQRHLRDFVEEDRAAIGHLEEAGACIAGIGERAALVAEQFALDQRRRERGAVHVDKRRLVIGRKAHRLGVDVSRQDALARARRAQREDARRRGRPAHLRDRGQRDG